MDSSFRYVPMEKIHLCKWSVYSILLPQLIDALIYVHHPRTVVLPDLANWSAFLEQVLPTI